MYQFWASIYTNGQYLKVWEQKPSSHPEKFYPCSCGSGQDYKGRNLACFRLEQVGYTGLRASDLCPVCLGGAIADPCQPSHRR